MPTQLLRFGCSALVVASLATGCAATEAEAPESVESELSLETTYKGEAVFGTDSGAKIKVTTRAWSTGFYLQATYKLEGDGRFAAARKEECSLAGEPSRSTTTSDMEIRCAIFTIERRAGAFLVTAPTNRGVRGYEGSRFKNLFGVVSTSTVPAALLSAKRVDAVEMADYMNAVSASVAGYETSAGSTSVERWAIDSYGRFALSFRFSSGKRLNCAATGTEPTSEAGYIASNFPFEIPHGTRRFEDLVDWQLAQDWCANPR